MEKIDFYDETKGTINPKLFSDIAEKLAEQIYRSGLKRLNDGTFKHEHNKRTQIRKFFDEVVKLNGNLKANPDDWDTILPYLNMMIAKAVYAKSRNQLVTDEFVNMLKQCIGQVNKPKDLEVFSDFFEAFMGYYRQYGAN